MSRLVLVVHGIGQKLEAANIAQARRSMVGTCWHGGQRLFALVHFLRIKLQGVIWLIHVHFAGCGQLSERAAPGGSGPGAVGSAGRAGGGRCAVLRGCFMQLGRKGVSELWMSRWRQVRCLLMVALLFLAP